MRKSHSHLRTLALTLGLGTAALLIACGGDDSGGGTGGTKGTGGGTGSGGTRTTGGATGSGGSRATGGSTGAGGATVTGGTTAAGGTSGPGGAGTGGTVTTGGTTGGLGGIDGSAGIDGAAGDTPIGVDGAARVDGAADDAPIGVDAPMGSDGSAIVDVVALDGPASDGPLASRTLFDFANTSQGWVYGSWQAKDSNGQPVAPFNLAVSGMQIDGGAMPTIGWDGTVGDPAGSLRMTVDFSNWQQQVIPTVVWSAPLPNWTGRTITLRVRLAAVPPASLDSSGLVIYAQDGNSALSKQLLSAFPADTEWHTLSLPVVAEAGSSFNAGSIKSLTVGIYSSAPPAALDGGTVPAFTPAGITVYVDSIVLH